MKSRLEEIWWVALHRNNACIPETTTCSLYILSFLETFWGIFFLVWCRPSAAVFWAFHSRWNFGSWCSCNVSALWSERRRLFEFSCSPIWAETWVYTCFYLRVCKMAAVWVSWSHSTLWQGFLTRRDVTGFKKKNLAMSLKSQSLI